MTPSQNRQIHTLLNQLPKAMANKYVIAGQFVPRTIHNWTEDISINEAAAIIYHLRQQLPQGIDMNSAGKIGPTEINKTENTAQKKRMACIAIAHKLGWKMPNNPSKADVKRLSDWCVSHGKHHIPLNSHTATQLSTIIYQLNEMLEKQNKALRKL